MAGRLWLSAKELYDIYLHIIKFREVYTYFRPIVIKEYCKQNKLDERKFIATQKTLSYKFYMPPSEYEKTRRFYEEEINSNFGTVDDLALKLKIPRSKVGKWVTHINYMKKIENYEKNQKIKIEEQEKTQTAIEEEELNTPENFEFIEVPNVTLPTATQPQPQKEDKSLSNQLELTAPHGIKIIIPSEVSTTVIIKIIELIKDL